MADNQFAAMDLEDPWNNPLAVTKTVRILTRSHRGNLQDVIDVGMRRVRGHKALKLCLILAQSCYNANLTINAFQKRTLSIVSRFDTRNRANCSH